MNGKLTRTVYLICCTMLLFSVIFLKMFLEANSLNLYLQIKKRVPLQVTQMTTIHTQKIKDPLFVLLGRNPADTAY